MGTVIYRLTPYGKTRRALAGVPWRDLTPEEFEAAKALHPGIENGGYFVAVEPQAEAEDERPSRKRASQED